ncbi:MAG: hypothetical protein GVY13_12550 [Alphaproteobacteria bacterium]|jgi:hypothetical protein|nr:hypothetical protein [Alphaproteobacteria bacterium]
MLVFADGAAALTVDGDQLMLEGSIVDATPAPIAATLDPAIASEAAFGPDWLL